MPNPARLPNPASVPKAAKRNMLLKKTEVYHKDKKKQALEIYF